MSGALRLATANAIAGGAAGDPWYGSATLALVGDVTPEQAVAHPVAGGHSIWELLLHTIAWRREVLARLQGAAPALPAVGDWPPVPDPTAKAWDRTRDELSAIGRRIADAVTAAPDSLFEEAVGEGRSRELGTGVTYGDMLIGLAQHDAYHAGQIALLRKLVQNTAR